MTFSRSATTLNVSIVRDCSSSNGQVMYACPKRARAVDTPVDVPLRSSIGVATNLFRS